MAYRAGILHQDAIQFATLTADSFEPLLAPSQLQDPDLGAVFRTLPDDDSFVLIAALAEATPIGALVLGAFSGTSGASFRVKLSADDPTGDDGDVYDSGLLSNVFDPTYRHLVHLLPSNLTASYIRLEASQTAAPFLEAGYFMAGPLWTPQVSFDYGFVYKTEDFDQIVTTRSGVDYIAQGGSRRRFGCEFKAVNTAELRAQLELIAVRVKRRAPILFVTDTASDNLGRDSYLGRLQNVPEFKNSFPGGYFSWAVDVAEII